MFPPIKLSAATLSGLSGLELARIMLTTTSGYGETEAVASLRRAIIGELADLIERRVYVETDNAEQAEATAAAFRRLATVKVSA